MYFNVLITTRILSQSRISEEKTDRHKIISELCNDGFSGKQISEYLNEHQINTPTGLEYYPRLIWITRKKMRRTKERSLDVKSNLSEMVSRHNLQIQKHYVVAASLITR